MKVVAFRGQKGFTREDRKGLTEHPLSSQSQRYKEGRNQGTTMIGSFEEVRKAWSQELRIATCIVFARAEHQRERVPNYHNKKRNHPTVRSRRRVRSRSHHNNFGEKKRPSQAGKGKEMLHLGGFQIRGGMRSARVKVDGREKTIGMSYGEPPPACRVSKRKLLFKTLLGNSRGEGR